MNRDVAHIHVHVSIKHTVEVIHSAHIKFSDWKQTYEHSVCRVGQGLP